MARLASLVAVLCASAASAAAQDMDWIRQIGTPAGDGAWALASDDVGGVFVAGDTGGDLAAPNLGLTDVWLAHYDAAGNPTWMRQFGTSYGEYTSAAAGDGAGGVFLAGWTNGDLGGTKQGGPDAWLARFDGAGNQVWIRQLGSIGSEGASGVAPDGSGGLYITGETSGSLGGTNLGSDDAYLARYDSAGNPLWVRQLGTSAADHSTCAAADGLGGVYVSGWTYGDLGGPSAGEWDAWLARYDSAGSQLWVRQFGSSANDLALGAAPNGSGGVFLCGGTSGDLGAGSAGGGDLWLAQYDATGTLGWIIQLGTNTHDGATRVAPDGAGGVYACGDTYGSLAALHVGATSQADAWLARFDASGQQLWMRQFGTAAPETPRAVAMDALGGVCTAGDTNGELGGGWAGSSDPWVARFDASSPLPNVYCTAKTNSLGCTPSLTMTNVPSVSAGMGCSIVTVNVVGKKNGFFFHGTQGPSALPFHGGFLCVRPPIRRHAIQNSEGSSGSCSGSYLEDLNTYIAAGFDPALVAGGQVWIQTWSRDPADPFTDSLSDAVTATIGL